MEFCLRGSEARLRVALQPHVSGAACPQWCSWYDTEDACTAACHNLTRCRTNTIENKSTITENNHGIGPY